MTTSQKKGALAVLVSIAIPILAAVASAGAARQQLTEKEDTSAHVLDVQELRAAMKLQQVRDSAQMATMFARITDVACEQNPSRRYC